MKAFTYYRAESSEEAVSIAAAHQGTYLAGGSNLLDLMRHGVATPDVLVDVSRLPGDIRLGSGGGLELGAAATNSAVAEHPDVRHHFRLISDAILNGASGQIRNMATVAGNLLQRTRCLSFYDNELACNKRVEGSGCSARGGDQHNHAILGASAHCSATHPSDFAVALTALDAQVHTVGPDGTRVIAVESFHTLPGEHPAVENVLKPHELITQVTVPPLAFGNNAIYRKVRERASYAFALVSVAAALDVEDGRVRQVRIALGGVAPKPWRAHAAEQFLVGQPADEPTFRRAAEKAVEGAEPVADNAYKVELIVRTVADTLRVLAERGAAT